MNGEDAPEHDQIISYNDVAPGLDHNYELTADREQVNLNGEDAPEHNRIMSNYDAAGDLNRDYERTADIEQINLNGEGAPEHDQNISYYNRAGDLDRDYERTTDVGQVSLNGEDTPEHDRIISYYDAAGSLNNDNERNASTEQIDLNSENTLNVNSKDAPEHDQVISYPYVAVDPEYEQTVPNEEGSLERDQIISYCDGAGGIDNYYARTADIERSNLNAPEHYQLISYPDVADGYDNDYEGNSDKELESSDDTLDDFMEIEYDSVSDSTELVPDVHQYYDESAAPFVDGELQNSFSNVIDQDEEGNSHQNFRPERNHRVVESGNVESDVDVETNYSNAIDEDDYWFEDSCGHNDASVATRIDGRRIVELDRFIKQLIDVADHNFGECLFEDTVVTKEIKNGLQSKLIFQCQNCGKKFPPILTNEDTKTTETLCVNSTAVLASNMIGIGYSQMKQFTSVLDIPTMCADRFKSLNDDIGAMWEITAEQSMKEAAEEERQAAIARGDIDEEDGIPFISVVTDGCWCKRSYNKNYNALSGVAAIVGATFGKVLWIGVRNKYCVICVRNKNKNTTPPDHFCTRNYTGPSSDMEWQSIVQGFEKSVEMYNLRYMTVIADGDSSTYSKLLEKRPYQHRIIEKDECCNHLLRNFRKQLESSATGCPRGLTKHVENNLQRIRKGISCAVKNRNSEQIDENEKVSLLKSDISNVIHHVFGDHSNCPEYIKENCKEEENHIPALMQSGTYDKLSIPIRKLMYCSKDLLLGETNNIAEHYNSIVAKFVGGKRINFALSNSYSYKANAAAVQFNTKRAVTALYQTVFQRDPPVLTQKIELKRLQKSLREKNRRATNKANHIRPKRFNDTKEKGSGYGANCETTDLSAADFENEKKIFLDKLKQNHENRNTIEEQTRTKERNALLQRITSTVLMDSNFGSVCKSRVMTKQVKNICKQMVSQNKATKHNNESQPIAKKQLEKEQQISIRDCGVYIDKEIMYLAASPSGITIDDAMIIEIQCPRTIASKNPNTDAVLRE